MCLCPWEHFANCDSSSCCHFGVVMVKSAFTRKTLVSAQNAIKSSW